MGRFSFDRKRIGPLVEPTDEDLEVVDALCSVEHGLSEWEAEFVESVARRVRREKRAPTPAQRRKLDDIAARLGV